MLSNIRTYLEQPYPCNNQPQNFLKVIAIFSGFVAAFLYVFQPFGIASLPAHHDLWISLSFGGVTLVSLLLSLILYQLLPQVFNDDNWTLGKELFFSAVNFFLVGNGNYLFIKYGWYRVDGYFDYGGMLFATFAVGFFPYTFLLLTSHMRNLRLNADRAEELTSELHGLGKESQLASNSLILHGQNSDELLEVNPSKLIRISSLGNYVEVYHKENDLLKKDVLRSALASIEEELSDHGNFFRCHRTHLVNLDKVKEVTGNSQGYRLRFEEDIDDVPVARTKNTQFRIAISKMNS